jgi:hypothetical protein
MVDLVVHDDWVVVILTLFLFFFWLQIFGIWRNLELHAFSPVCRLLRRLLLRPVLCFVNLKIYKSRDLCSHSYVFICINLENCYDAIPNFVLKVMKFDGYMFCP